MVETTPGFSGLRITNYWKYILYISGVILVLSIFVPAQELSNTYVRNIAFEITLGGLIIWFFKNISNRFLDFVDDYNIKEAVIGITIVDYIIQGIIWAFIFLRNF